ncbi:hypothetical protein MVES1_003104 [Malassezia vespertilionis]|uniref:Glutathione S-transferase n=1 Tax=Malassezia vespertilionis TaxID=2020962 RepID=A0A2N1J9Q8_9BASI|nr:uncharacterized protein MVES1_003104 [Malassezia vespertilionis]PKI83275.1 hypothetical protein MVES_002946 [Malassezia vespertilionis]WFD07734.1 hypothetical protein MVES1_003104 [Malassezia vespertilionis]
MFVPNKVLSPENIGTIEVFGVSLSTNTQSVMIALKELGIAYLHHNTMPNSPELHTLSPFGAIPVLMHRPNGMYSGRDSVALYEVLAISRYIDEILSEQESNDPSVRSLLPRLPQSHTRSYADKALTRVEIEQMCAVIIHRVQTVVEDEYVKPYFALRNNGASAADIEAGLGEGLQAAEGVLMLLEAVINQSQKHLNIAGADYMFGSNVTWSDIFLFPILRDFKATKPSILQGDSSSRLPWLTGWVSRFEQRPSAAATLPGTFAASA